MRVTCWRRDESQSKFKFADLIHLSTPPSLWVPHLDQSSINFPHTTIMSNTITSLSKCPLCEHGPCRHADSLCFDKDYLADLDDFSTDRELQRKIWRCHSHPSERADLGLDDAKYQDKLDRCQRIINKRTKIEAEIDANNSRRLRSWGYTGPDISEVIDWMVNIKDVNKRCAEILREAKEKREALRTERSAGIGNSES